MRILVISDAFDTVLQMTFSSLMERYGAEVYVIGPAGLNVKATKLITSAPISSKFQLSVIRDIRKAVKKYNIDVVFAPSTSGLSNALFATIGTNANVVGYRGTQHRIHRTDPTHYLALLNPRLSHVVCETKDIHEYLRKFIPESKLSGMPKPYQVEWVADAITSPKESPFNNSSLRCIYIGNSKNRPFKGLSFLIEAMRSLESEGVTLTVIGSVDENDMQTAPANVIFLGSKSDAVYYLPSHDLLILPSTRDASPRVIREAHACGLPCIVSDIPGARDLIVDGITGLLVPAASPEAIVVAVERFLSDKSQVKIMGDAGQKHIIDNFGMEPYVDYYYNLFKSLI